MIKLWNPGFNVSSQIILIFCLHLLYVDVFVLLFLCIALAVLIQILVSNATYCIDIGNQRVTLCALDYSVLIRGVCFVA